ncbi:putative anion transporter 5 [Abeliophyllum distichum]|uniref:Anion transporter 5 n=1 Tax=Abeliophyllum distichum TaxID=126358 RepID=A0ABD1V7Z9_9LAMI
MWMWTLLRFKYANDPPRSEHPKATVAGFGELLLPIKVNQKMKVENGGHSIRTPKIPCKKIIFSLPVWAIVVNNFTFHYALYMLTNWLPTYFELVLQVRHGIYQDDALLVGVIADHLITKRLLSVIRRTKLLNTIGFVVASFALMALPRFRNQNTWCSVLFFCGSWFLVTWESWICSKSHGCCSRVCRNCNGVNLILLNFNKQLIFSYKQEK